MDDQCNRAAISAIAERQRLIVERMKTISSFFYWSSNFVSHSVCDLKDIPKNAWIEPSIYTDWEKWEELLWRKVTPSQHIVAEKNSFLSSVFAELIKKNNDPAEIRKRAESLAYLEWQLKQITFWASPSKEPERTWKISFDLLTCQRQFIRDCALEAICLYQCGAHDALNDFERYASTALADWDCSRLFENAVHKMLVGVKVYEEGFERSQASSKKGKGRSNPDILNTWMKIELSKNSKTSAKQFWSLISKDENNPTIVGTDGQLWVSEAEDTCYLDERKNVSAVKYRTFENRLSKLQKQN